MGQRSQIYIKYDDELIVANYYQWNYGERMISRARAIIEYIKNYIDLDYKWVFSDKSRIKKLSRICDINFDMRDVAISIDIVEEWKEYSDEPFNQYVFDAQDNNDGQLFIHITKDNKIKFAFTKHTERDETLDSATYMNWNIGEDWKTPTAYFEADDIEICKNNIEYIDGTAELMTAGELNLFITSCVEPTPFTEC